MNLNKNNNSTLLVDAEENEGNAFISHGMNNNNNNNVNSTSMINENNISNFSQKEVLIWIKINLSKNGINNNKIKLFLIEFNKKCITGSILLKFKNNEKLIDSFIKQFSEENQAFGIWMILKSMIQNIDQ